MNKIISIAIIGIVLCFPYAFAEGITKEQGDAILKELRELRLTIERLSSPNRRAQQANAPAAPVELEVSIENGNIIGEQDAPVTLVQFTDYECPYCARFFKDALKGLRADYIDQGKLNLVVRDLPLAFHANAIGAAHATRCASEQNMFIEMHDKLYLHPKALEKEKLSGYAEQVGLNRKKFDTCMQSEKYIAAINEGVTEIQSLGISGTPTFVLGKAKDGKVKGNKIIGAQPLTAFEAQIKKLLEQEG